MIFSANIRICDYLVKRVIHVIFYICHKAISTTLSENQIKAGRVVTISNIYHKEIVTIIKF